MTETWRQKRYYRPRILIQTDAILSSSIPDGIVCLTGAQINMLRALLEYAERRSTFVSEYHGSYYLAPSDSEWEQISDVVARAQEALMSCDDIVAQLQCICNALQYNQTRTIPDHSTVLTPGIYSDLEGSGTLAYTSPDGTVTVAVDADACAISQLVWQFAYEAFSEYIQPGQDIMHDALLFAVLEAVGLALGGPIGGLGAAAVFALVEGLADAFVNSRQTQVLNNLATYKDELVCATYNTLTAGGTFSDAAAACAAVIVSMPDFGEGDEIVMKALFSPLVLNIVKSGWAATSAWAVANVTAGYCSVCEWLGFTGYWEAEAPPCPGVFTFGGGAACGTDGTWGSVPSVTGGSQYIYGPWFPVPAGSYSLQHTLEYRSTRALNWDCGQSRWFRAYQPDKSDATLVKQHNIKSAGAGVAKVDVQDLGGLGFASNGYLRWELQSWGSSYTERFHSVRIDIT